MCLIVFAWDIHPEYKLIFSSNRDEFYQRPTLPLNYWKDHTDILAGRDQKAGGTWLGVNKSGKLAAITNYRDPNIIKENPPSRGNLTTNFLLSDLNAENYLNQVKENAQEYNGFNLLMYDNDSLCFYSNVEDKVKVLPPGVYGLSNHLLNTSWPKVETLKESFLKTINNNQPISSLSLVDNLFENLLNNTQPKDEDLPDTGISKEWERAVGPIFIKTETYGTSSSAIVLIDRKGKVTFEEKRYLNKEQSKFSFDITVS